MHSVDQQLKRRRPTAASIGIAFLLLAAAAVYVSSYADYEPHAKVSGVIAAAMDARHGLDKACVDTNSKPERAALSGALKQASFPKAVARHALHFAADGSALLELDLADIAWGAPWRFGETAIRSGSAVTFAGSCAEPGRYEWRFASATVPRQFLPTSLRGKR